jgi:hypothetical protein
MICGITVRMTTSIPLGQAAVFDFSITAGGSPDTTTPASVSPSLPGIFRCTMNPSNNRQFAVVPLVASGSTNANVACGPITLHAFCSAASAPPPTPDGGSINEAGVTIGPIPSWA